MALILDDLTFSRNQVSVVQSLTLQVKPFQRVAFLGPNGAGKTTVLKILAGITSLPIKKNHTKHTIHLDDCCLCTTSIAERIASGLVYMPQQSTLFYELTAIENIEIIFEYHPFWKKKIRKDFLDFLSSWIDRMSLGSCLSTRADRLSGGQKRKVELLRTIAMQPKYLLLDEPFAGVDPKSIEEIQEMLAALAATGVGILISDHHVFQLLHMVDYVYVLVGGKLVSHGDPQKIMYDSTTQNVYLGKKMGYHK